MTTTALDLRSSLDFVFDFPLPVIGSAVESEESVELLTSAVRRESLRVLLVLGCCLRGLPGATDRAYFGSVPDKTWPSSSASSTYAMCDGGYEVRFPIARIW